MFTRKQSGLFSYTPQFFLVLLVQTGGTVSSIAPLVREAKIALASPLANTANNPSHS